ncbi:MAG: hypothetical protein J5680_07585 [Neisseriaceae bacterium]|nr:hypothetical protein [Neisseriaceae bacterium]MBR5676237.1 hypothetical protein [Neisseriaceae bacterium]
MKKKHKWRDEISYGGHFILPKWTQYKMLSGCLKQHIMLIFHFNLLTRQYKYYVQL